MRRIIRILAIAMAIVVIIAGGTYLWAYLATGTSLVARGILWGDSDAGDLYRFPTRRITAGGDPVLFALQQVEGQAPDQQGGHQEDPPYPDHGPAFHRFTLPEGGRI